jgi:hypothetical protein
MVLRDAGAMGNSTSVLILIRSRTHRLLAVVAVVLVMMMMVILLVVVLVVVCESVGLAVDGHVVGHVAPETARCEDAGQAKLYATADSRFPFPGTRTRAGSTSDRLGPSPWIAEAQSGSQRLRHGERAGAEGGRVRRLLGRPLPGLNGQEKPKQATGDRSPGRAVELELDKRDTGFDSD